MSAVRFALAPIVALALTALVGCGSTVQSPPLALKPLQVLQWRSFVDPQLRQQIGLGDVQGGDAGAADFLGQTLRWLWGTHTPNAVVQDALEDQLRALQLLAAAPHPGRYRLDARIISLEASGLLGGAEATARVEYTVRENLPEAQAAPGAADGPGRILYQRQVRSQGEAAWLSHLMSGDRQRLAKQAALRAGLVVLAQDLVQLRV
ncbi:hypothetical protein [Inhella gelatinilytica]|uniref:ABC-type transport auxiliary lipoprotein component domain-containing protein n=1 Tax=Inhella gelatinilytica TaxID=2795030 RepID=A0A931IVF6_9BURK|nr:hypothetical protein [Inhella gelatinilytica]MBH9551714.1 hypothetical protein [Inhella gelatinilytica]